MSTSSTPSNPPSSPSSHPPYPPTNHGHSPPWDSNGMTRTVLTDRCPASPGPGMTPSTHPLFSSELILSRSITTITGNCTQPVHAASPTTTSLPDTPSNTALTPTTTSPANAAAHLPASTHSSTAPSTPTHAVAISATTHTWTTSLARKPAVEPLRSL